MTEPFKKIIAIVLCEREPFTLQKIFYYDAEAILLYFKKDVVSFCHIANTV